MEFLFSRNRLNVAISRARAVTIVVASPLLLEAPCRTLEQLKLVNTLCFAKHYADRLASTQQSARPAVDFREQRSARESAI
jgi:hypothetical protein